MTALWILLGILAFILLIVVILSVKFTLFMSFDDEFKLAVKWLFIKIKILPKAEKEEKPKKEKPKKANPEKEKKLRKSRRRITFSLLSTKIKAYQV